MTKFIIHLFLLILCSNIKSQNLIQNSDFQAGSPQSGSSSLFVANGVPNWKASHGSPNIWTISGDQSANVVLGSGIYTNCAFVAGQTYRISLKIGYNANLIIKAANQLTANNSSLPNPQSVLIHEVPANNFNPQAHTQYFYFTPTQNYSQIWFYSSVSVLGTSSNYGAVIDNISVVPCGGYNSTFTQTSCKMKSTVRMTCTNAPVTATQNNWQVFQEDTPNPTPTSNAIASTSGDNPVISVSPSKRYLIVIHTVANNGCTASTSTHVIDRLNLVLCGITNEALEMMSTKN